jgi:uncharacterized glyoxalase superfamily protein PhnB
MSKNSASIIPCCSYRDAAAAIEWLGKAFGFEKHLVVPGENGTIAHAELVFGNGMLMLGSAKAGPESASICVIVPDADAHAQRALAAGAEIVRPVHDQDYGGRGYGCRDLEGHSWYFTTYDPWASRG